jgi:hypothetical protein
VIGHFIVRLVAIATGFVLAVIAAALFLSIGVVRDVVGPAIEYHAGIEAEGWLVPVVGIVTSPFLAATVLAPAGIAIALAETAKLRGLVINLTLAGLVALYAGWRSLTLEPDLSLNQGVIVVLLAAGFCAGLVYWLVAGRSAGRWLE